MRNSAITGKCINTDFREKLHCITSPNFSGKYSLSRATGLPPRPNVASHDAQAVSCDIGSYSRQSARRDASVTPPQQFYSDSVPTIAFVIVFLPKLATLHVTP